MRDPPARRDGRWLMTRLNLRRRNTQHPANERVPRLFLPPSWYRVVSHGVSGLQDEILSTDHDVSRHSLAYPSLLSLSLTLSSCLAPTRPIASPLQVNPTLLFSPSSLSLTLFGRERSHLFQTTMLDGRLRLIRQRRTREADRCNQEDRFTKV